MLFFLKINVNNFGPTSAIIVFGKESHVEEEAAMIYDATKMRGQRDSSSAGNKLTLLITNKVSKQITEIVVESEMCS